MKNFTKLLSILVVCLLGISMTFGQEDVLNEGFASEPEGWEFENTFFSGNHDNGIYVEEGVESNAVKMKDPMSYIVTSAYSGVGDFTFWYYPRQDGTVNGTLTIQKSIDGGETWVDIDVITVTSDLVGEWHESTTYEVNELIVQLKLVVETGNSNFYLDDFTLTAMDIPTDVAELDSIFINDGYMLAVLDQMSYEANLYYTSEVEVSATPLAPNASVTVAQAADIFSETEADRTSTITVISEDASVTKEFDIKFNINMDTLVYVPFDNSTLHDFYSSNSGFIFTPPSNGNTLPEPEDGTEAFSFVYSSDDEQASIISIHPVPGVKTFSFNAAVRKDEGDDFDVLIYSYTGEDSTLVETLTVTGSGMTTDAWSEFSYNINEVESTGFKFISTQTDETSSRIAVDNIVLTRDQTTTSVVSPATLNNVKVYPNPAKSTIRITGITDEFNVSVLSLTGSQIISKDNAETLDVSMLSPGLYIVYVEFGNQSFVQKLIIN